MFRNAIVGIDGREGGTEALALARGLTAGAEALLLVNVRTLYPAPYGPGGAEPASDTREAAVELLERERERGGVPTAATLTVVDPPVADALHAVASERGSDLIVVGSCHRGPVGRALIGDDARATLHHAPCAVAVAPHGYAPATAHPRTIGVAFDGSEPSRAALEEAGRLARMMGARLRALRVAEMTVHGSAGFAVPIVENERELLDRTRAETGELPGVELDVVVGLTGPELTRFSSEVDLLVCGSRRNGPVRRLLLGSTSTHLVGNCHCPLLVVPRVRRATPSRPSDTPAAGTRTATSAKARTARPAWTPRTAPAHPETAARR